ncbi:hypothetical protein [Salmonella enterica]
MGVVKHDRYFYSTVIAMFWNWFEHVKGVLEVAVLLLSLWEFFRPFGG